MKEMTSSTVLELVEFLEGNGVEIWLDGGWGVDALLGRQTRPHGDLDLAVRHGDVPKLRELLVTRGYRDVPREGTSDWNFVLGNDQGHEVDVHSYGLDSEGRHVYGIEYSVDSLTGIGSLNGLAVKCIAADHMVRFRTDYELREVDIEDVRALHERFGIPIPKEHEDWLERRRSEGKSRDEARMKIRKSARIIVLNPAGSVLLVRYHDSEPVDPTKPELLAYWVPPGGGVDEGESYERAAIRELEEETGIELSDLGPQIWSRERQLMHRGEPKRYLERYFIAWTDAPRHLRNRTMEKIEEIRWWTLDEMRASMETFLPQGFVELVAPVMAGNLPSAPIDIA